MQTRLYRRCPTINVSALTVVMTIISVWVNGFDRENRVGKCLGQRIGVVAGRDDRIYQRNGANGRSLTTVGLTEIVELADGSRSPIAKLSVSPAFRTESGRMSAVGRSLRSASGVPDGNFIAVGFRLLRRTRLCLFHSR